MTKAKPATKTKAPRKTPVKKAAPVKPETLLPVAATPMAMLDRAVSAGADVKTIEKLMTLQERWEMNKARRLFDAAMSDAKKEFPEIKKSASVDYEGNKGRVAYNYEDLASIARAVDPILAVHGLSYRFRSDQDGNTVKVTCIVAHREGYREEVTLGGPNDNSGGKNAIQAVGSAVTYLQRYTLKLALGIAATADDDAQAATRDTSPPKQRQSNGNQQRQGQRYENNTQQRPGRQSVTAEQFCDLRDMASEAQISESVVCKGYGAKSFQDFPADRYETCMRKLKVTIDARATHEADLEKERENQNLPHGEDSDGSDAQNFNTENGDLDGDHIPH